MSPYITKGTLQMWLNEGVWDGEINLDCPSELSVITAVLIRGIQEESKSRRRHSDDKSKSWSNTVWRWTRGPRAKKYRQPLELKKAKKLIFFSQGFKQTKSKIQKENKKNNPDNTLTLAQSVEIILDFWPPKL